MPKYFKEVTPSVNFPKLEEEILTYWKKNKIFEKSLKKKSPYGDWTFLDGPPFVTGMPHYGSLLSSLPKDVFGRYWTMKGYHVRRVWGWDGHGLPIENKVEGELEVKRKKDIEEKIGVKKFIERCLHYVNQVSGEWEWYVDHIGRWVDFKNSYKTWDLPYMESVMWVFKQMYDKGYIYKGLRVSLYCPHCATPISNFEVAMDADNYKDTTDHGTIYKYEIEKNTYILAWSTTPWNKIVTTALAVNPKLDYIKVKQNGEQYILAKSTVEILKQVQDDTKKDYEVLETFKGKELIGKKFVPHYDYYKAKDAEKIFEIIPGDFVTAEEGTGVVTIAAYGEEDLKAMQENNIHMEMHLDEEGNIKPDVPLFGGMYYLKANKLVNEDLAKRNLLYEDKEYIHKVPLCWRCHTRLYYAPMDAWYVNVQKLKKQMEKNNAFVNWVPSHFKHGRFEKSLENAPDWNISRNRYWGSPVPVWECECNERFVPGSISELEEASGQKITNLHKPEIDEVTVVCKKCGKKAHRVSEVLDSWIEAGSASFGERHYPFGTELDVESFYPPKFISEYTGQIRAWFYVLHVIANALALRKDDKNYLSENVLVTGVILGTDGRKMSKNFKNYPDPKEMLQKYGGDALRLYLLGSPVMRGEDILISEEQYKQQVRGTMLILWNVYSFFVTYANIDGFKIQDLRFKNPENTLDRWIVSKLENFKKNITDSYERFDTVSAVALTSEFINLLSTWYVRRIRDRVGPTVENGEDKNEAYQTLWFVLTSVSKLIAPLSPFLSEEIYRNLNPQSESVHLENWSEFEQTYVNQALEEEMKQAINLASTVHAFRKQSGVKVRIPFKELSYTGPQVSEEVLPIVLEEVNVYHLQFKGKADQYEVTGDTSENNQDLEAGISRDIIRQIQQERKTLGTTYDEKVDVVLSGWPEKHGEEIKKKALVRNLTKGEAFKVAKI